jgi:hypothetical protein
MLEQKTKSILFNFRIEFIITSNFSVGLFVAFQTRCLSLEPSPTFVISPMMERTLFQLTEAISAYRIGVVHAPVQYGRSTVIQTLVQVRSLTSISLGWKKISFVF